MLPDSPNTRGGTKRRWWIFVIPISVAAVCSLVLFLISPEQTEFPLAMAPAPPAWAVLSYGCSSTPDSKVVKYPVFASSKPLFGIVLRPLPAEHERDRNANAAIHHFALDESRGAGTGYDMLYFDANANLDLTDDSPHRRLTKPPQQWRVVGSRRVYFDDIEVPFDYGPPVGRRLFAMVPVLDPQRSPGAPGSAVSARAGTRTTEPEPAVLNLSPASAREGTVRFGGRKYRALLIRPDLVPRYDLQDTRIEFFRPARVGFSSPFPPFVAWLPAEQVGMSLGGAFPIGKSCYVFRATPTGDRLTVTRFER